MVSSRIAVFLSIVLGIWSAMHGYVFWRLSTLPWVATHVSNKALAVAAVLLWLSYPASRFFESWHLKILSWPLEYVGSLWIGTLFLLLATLLAVEFITLAGWVFPRAAPTIRSCAVLLALLLSLVAYAQALRPPVVRDYEVSLAGLPKERDGIVLLEISDLHLGTLIGQRWLSALTQRINAMRPDLILMVGDLVDGNVLPVEPMRPLLRQWKAPLGVWAVTGNHEYYAGVHRSVRLFEEVGFRVLRDRSAEVVPGLVLAGVDDLTGREQYGARNGAVEKALADRPAGATIFLSHSPWQADVAAQAGAGLMLCGHTHNGQIWPFTHLVGLRYPLRAGRYRVDGMDVIVCRGTGTWGPRRRLWRPSEMVRVTLRSKDQ